jgi:hypothetical protein
MIIQIISLLIILLLVYNFIITPFKESFECDLSNPNKIECNEYKLEKNEDRINKLKQLMQKLDGKFNKIRDTELINRKLIKKNHSNLEKMNEVTKK